jgi:hypothetical protein
MRREYYGEVGVRREEVTATAEEPVSVGGVEDPPVVTEFHAQATDEDMDIVLAHGEDREEAPVPLERAETADTTGGVDHVSSSTLSRRPLVDLGNRRYQRQVRRSSGLTPSRKRVHRLPIHATATTGDSLLRNQTWPLVYACCSTLSPTCSVLVRCSRDPRADMRDMKMTLTPRRTP